MAETLKQRTEKRYSALKNERQQGWDPHWREISENFLPRKGRWLFEKANKGGKMNQSIINSTPLMAVRTLASGMMAGLTSPARPWFRLTTPDPEMMEFGPVREWLYQTEVRMREMFSKTNLYNVLPTMYAELGGFGTASVVALEHPEKVMRFQAMTIGSYYLATNDNLEVDTIYRELNMTVRNLVTRFGIDNVSAHVRALFRQNQLDQWIDVIHAVEPNKDLTFGMKDNQNMEFASLWYERGGDVTSEFLGKSGFNEFPVMAPRWETTAEDIYGSSPGMIALGDAKMLQFQERRKAKAIDKHVDPPMTASVALKGKRASLIAGDITYVDPTKSNGFGGFQPAYTIKPELQALLLDIQDNEKRINSVFYVDLFLMLAMSDRRQMTATEVAERHEEKLLMLGPVLERLNDELLDPLIDRSFAVMMRRGLLPPPPEELAGIDLKVEYISVLAQAQRAVGLGAIDRLATYVFSAAQADPSVMDKFDLDQSVDEYASMLGTPPSLVRSDDKVESIRDERAQAEQAAQMAESMQQAASIGKDLSQSGMEGNNALTALTGGAQTQ